MANATVTVNSNSFTESNMDPELRTTINELLLSNNCIPQIHATLLHEAQASGFVEQIRNRAHDLLRTGKATTFTECMEQIMAHVKIEGIDADATSTNGASKDASKATEHAEKLVVPRSVVKEGFDAIAKQLDPYLGFGDQGEGTTAS